MALQNLDKLILSVFATVITLCAWSLVLAGSFVPQWARPLNSSIASNSSTYSLWGRQDCYDYICQTTIRQIKRTVVDEWTEKGVPVEKSKIFVVYQHITKCEKVNFCNTTWFENEEFENIPSLLFVSRAFIIPSIITGLVTIVLYCIKIVMIVVRPQWRRIHIKAAYLTFSAVAGCTAGISVIIFVTMIEEDFLELLWAPALPGAGAFLFLMIAVGGYLSWRNQTTDDEFDDHSDISDRHSNVYEFSSAGHGKPSSVFGSNGSRGAPPPVAPKGYHLTIHNQSARSDVV